MSEHEHTEDPGFEEQREARDEEVEETGSGQVSEVSGMEREDADTPLAPAEAVAGYPESESGDAQEGAAGPDASEEENRRDSDV